MNKVRVLRISQWVLLGAILIIAMASFLNELVNNYPRTEPVSTTSRVNVAEKLVSDLPLIGSEDALSLSDLDGLVIEIKPGGSLCGDLYLTVAQAKALAERLGLPTRERNGKFIVVVQPGDEFRLTYYPEDFSLRWDKLTRL